jgi:hypothetical protein
MKFLKILEKAWMLAAVAAFVMGTYYLVMLRTVNYHVYFPYFCCLFCVLLYNNIRRQRKFLENMKRESEAKEKAASPDVK